MAGTDPFSLGRLSKTTECLLFQKLCTKVVSNVSFSLREEL